MATRAKSILGAATLPDGVVFQEPSSVNVLVNDRYPGMVYVFKDTGTRIKLGVGFYIPPNYVGTPIIRLIWLTVLTSGDVRWEADLTSIADGESGDPSADQESIPLTVTVPGTARLLKYTDLAFTAGTFAPNDFVQGVIARDGTEAADTAAGSVYLYDAQFLFSDT